MLFCGLIFKSETIVIINEAFHPENDSGKKFITKK
jgi:hypothetical protein